MLHWRVLNALPGVSDVEQIVAMFEVSSSRVPHGRFRVKVLERSRGGYIGIPNIAVRDPSDGADVGVTGHGETPDEALEDAIRGFLTLATETGASDEESYIWSDPEEF